MKKQERYNKSYGKSYIKGIQYDMSNLEERDNTMDMIKNPVVVSGLKSLGGELRTSRGGIYQPGTPLYDKFNGEYHIHADGKICAGNHKYKSKLTNGNAMNKNAFLTPLNLEEFEMQKKVKINPKDYPTNLGNQRRGWKKTKQSRIKNK